MILSCYTCSHKYLPLVCELYLSMTCMFQILYIQNINKAHFVEKTYKSNIIKHLCIIYDASGLGKESFLCTKLQSWCMKTHAL